jgi:predicted cupin superfamily sugar epimerase
MIDKDGNYKTIKIGKNLDKGEFLQYVVPANTWFASEIMHKKDFVLCGCTVSPGFDFKDFEMPSREELISLYPKHAKAISSLTHH